MNRTVIASLGLLVACEGSDMEPIGVDDEDVVEVCDTVVATTVPANGSTQAYYRGSVEFVLTEPDPEATVTASFPGTLDVREDGLRIVYTPSEPLAPNTTYEATLDYCGGKPTIEFTTSELGSALGDVDVVGRTYRVGLSDARFAGGPGLSDVAAELIARALLVQVVAIDEAGVHLRVAMPEDDDANAQAPCTMTLELPAADFTFAPYYTLQATDLVFGSMDTPITLASLAFTGTLSPDGSWMGGATFAAVLDARDVASLIDSSPEGLCSIAAGLGLPCEPCADNEPMCVAIDADGIVGEWLEGVSLESIPDPNALPECQ